MDPRERIASMEEVLLSHGDSVSASLYVAWPGVIQSVDLEAMTVSVQPTIMGQFRDKQGVIQNLALPVLLDCPIHFPSGGGFTLTFPIVPGDECLIIIADRCIDAWHSLGPGPAPNIARAPMEARFHDLSDGFVIPKVWSKPNVLPGVSGNTAQLRSDDGAMFVELAAGHVMNIVAPGGLNITAPTITMNASTKVVINTPELDVNNNGGDTVSIIRGPLGVTGDVTAAGTSVHTHLHSGVVPGGGDTGPPV